MASGSDEHLSGMGISESARVLFSQTNDHLSRMLGKDTKTVFTSGNEPEKRAVNKAFFGLSVSETDPVIKTALRKQHYDFFIKNLGPAEVVYTRQAGAETPGHSVIYGPIPDGAKINKGRINGKDLWLSIDLNNLEPVFTQFQDIYEKYMGGSHQDLVPGREIPPELAAAIKAAHVAQSIFFGQGERGRSKRNLQLYEEEGRIPLSRFKKGEYGPTAVCAELSALSQELLSFAGVATQLVGGGTLNSFPKTGGVDFADYKHDYLLVHSADATKTFLWDPYNSHVKTDPTGKFKYPFPAVTSVQPELLASFLKREKPIQSHRETMDLDYWL